MKRNKIDEISRKNRMKNLLVAKCLFCTINVRSNSTFSSSSFFTFFNEIYKLTTQTQWYVNGGKCGLCGDDYRLSTPRPNENGGSYGLGVIVGLYKVGAQIPVSVYLTANHKGYFLFDMCNLEQKNAIESDECFGKNKLKLSNGADRYSVPNTSTGWFNTTLQLPNELSCSQCVLRWTWIVGEHPVDINISF